MIRGSLRSVSSQILACFVLLVASAAACAQHQLVFTPFNPGGIYAVGEVAGWSVKPASSASNLHYSYTVMENNRTLVKAGRIDISSGSARIEVKLNEPAMILVEVFPESGSASPSAGIKAGGGVAAQSSVANTPKPDPVPEAVLGAAISPALLKPSVDRPSDFDAFWQGKLKTLATIPMHPELTQLPGDNPAVNLYTVKLDSVDSHVQGYLAKPNRQGKFPALIVYQYAGVYKLNQADTVKRAEAGWLTFNVDSHDLPPTAETGVPIDYFKIGNHDREKCYFLDMYLRDTRAIDYIVSRPDWDGKTLVLIGTSMGGQQSLVTAALNPQRISAVIVNEPAGADANGDLHGRKAGYPYWPSSDPEVGKTSLYFDPVNFAHLIKAPTIIAVGFIDTSAPPAGVWTLFNQLPGPKEIVTMIDSAHNNKTPDKQGNFTRRSNEALESLLHGNRLDLR